MSSGPTFLVSNIRGLYDVASHIFCLTLSTLCKYVDAANGTGRETGFGLQIPLN